jgi:hypothetical protein
MSTARRQRFHYEVSTLAAKYPLAALIERFAAAVLRVDLLKPFCRLLDLLNAPEDIPFLSNLIQREIVYRLLRGPHGERLRAIAMLGDQSHRTAKAIAWLQP